MPTYFTLPLILILAGCLGGGDGDRSSLASSGASGDRAALQSEVKSRTTQGRSLHAARQLDAEGYDDWLARVETAMAAARPEAAALTGTATYDGRAMGGYTDAAGDIAYRSGITLDADFTNGRLTGRMNDFAVYDSAHAEKQELAGELTINGTISADRMSARVDGTLGEGTDLKTTATGSLEGAFTDPAARYAVGTVDLDTGDGDKFEGVFRASKR